ncbi:MAG: hypothetical protein H0X69_16095 [Gemmatimonadales bacterium]|nr:hypothetical protein [Gemmatimonadales bacterium]
MSHPARVVTAEELFENPDSKQRVIVRYPDRPPSIVMAGEILDGEDVVPGFALAVAECSRRKPSDGGT